MHQLQYKTWTSNLSTWWATFNSTNKIASLWVLDYIFVVWKCLSLSVWKCFQANNQSKTAIIYTSPQWIIFKKSRMLNKRKETARRSDQSSLLFQSSTKNGYKFFKKVTFCEQNSLCSIVIQQSKNFNLRLYAFYDPTSLKPSHPFIYQPFNFNYNLFAPLHVLIFNNFCISWRSRYLTVLIMLLFPNDLQQTPIMFGWY